MSDRPILIVYNGSDDHVDLVRSELAGLGAPVLELDTADDDSTAGIGVTVERGECRTHLRLGGRDHHGDSIRSVLPRHIRLPRAWSRVLNRWQDPFGRRSDPGGRACPCRSGCPRPSGRTRPAGLPEGLGRVHRQGDAAVVCEVSSCRWGTRSRYIRRCMG